jgi:hypothetical protein
MGGARQGAGSIVYQSIGGPVERYTVHPWLRPEFEPEVKHLFLEIVYFLYFWGMNKKQDGQGGAQRPFWRGIEPKKTGARSARACTRGQNPLVYNRR